MIDNDSKQEILREISEIRALLTRLQPVESPHNAAAIDTEPGKRVVILF